MIVWNEDMRYGEGFADNRRGNRTKKRIAARKPVISAFCVALPTNPANLLDIYDAHEFLLPYYKNASLKLIGLSKSKEGAIQLATDIITEVYATTKTFDVRRYFGECDGDST